jgi:hypothetical protein
MSKLDHWISNYKEILTMRIKMCIVIKLPTVKMQGMCVVVSKKERDIHTAITSSF